jgi:two-component system, OmpR family, sensor histidine kinase CpxA
VRSLFLKIFLWFWAAMGVVVLVAIVAPWWADRGEPGAGWQRDLDDMLDVYARSAVDAYARGGAPALREYLGRREPPENAAGYLFGPDLTELSGRTPPGAVADALSRPRAHAPPGRRDEFFPSPPFMISRRTVAGPSGEPLTFVVAFRLVRREGPADVAARAAAVLVLVGALCYGLARYFTSPLGRLRAAAGRIADGDLSARVGPQARARRDEFGDLARDFDHMADRLEALVTRERQLLSDISHELRSPLARLGLAVGVVRGEPGADPRPMLERIELETERLDALIGELLTLARLQSGPAPMLREVDLAELLLGVIADADFEAQGLGRRVSTGPLEPCAVRGDEELLRRAVENVVRNAVRHTAEGTAVDVSLTRRAAGGSDEAVVVVRDRGAGVPDSELGAIFEPFYRVESARDRRSGGTGLGLAIADRAVRLHGGRIRAANAEGGGLEVSISVPAGRSD